MKRREALKNIGLTTGFVIASPGLISLLQSCKSDIDTWTPTFLSNEEGYVLKQLVDIILPKTDLPSATELNVPQFIDSYINQVLDDDEQGLAKAAFTDLVSLVKSDYNEDLEKVTAENYKALLDAHMRIKGEDDQDRLDDPESKKPTRSEFLNQLKWMSITAYKTTEEIGENVLAYDPIPAAYYCGDLDELTGGKSWSLPSSW